jgi:hypothetical protein|tara:strand:- start:576 stop:746 length:171 start_codon:yes stop_codon:yes gene_type:complete
MDPPSTSQEVTHLVNEQLKAVQLLLNDNEKFHFKLIALASQLALLKSALDRGVFDK